MTRAPLVRSETDRVLGGVCAGLAHHFELDPTLVRVAFVVGALVGPGLIAYIALWIAVPAASRAPQAAAGGVPPPNSNAVRIAEERFARGEITADELATIRADLTGVPAP